MDSLTVMRHCWPFGPTPSRTTLLVPSGWKGEAVCPGVLPLVGGRKLGAG